MLVFKKETTLPILVTVISVLAAALTILYGYRTGKFPWLENRNKKQTTEQNEEVKINRTEYTDVARKTLDWIDKQRNEEGWYILGKVCGQEDCEIVWDDKEVGNKDGLIATWARLNFYEQHHEEKDLNIVKKDIDLFYNKYKDKDLSDSLWLCKVTYEMAQSKYVDKEQKDKLKELCLKKKFLSDDKIKKYWPERFKRAGGVAYPPITWAYYSLQERYFDAFFGSITDLAYKHLWSSDNDNVVLINNYFLEIDNLIKNKKSIDSQNVCLFGISALDVYKNIDKSESVLNYSIELYNQFENNDDKYFENPICGLFIRRLFELTGEKKYLDKLKAINISLVSNSEKEERGESRDGETWGEVDIDVI